MRAVEKLHDIIDEEISSSKVSATKTMLAGFSQGGALAMYAALTYHKRLAAVMVMSSWPVLRHTMPDVSMIWGSNKWVKTEILVRQADKKLKKNYGETTHSKFLKLKITKILAIYSISMSIIIFCSVSNRNSNLMHLSLRASILDHSFRILVHLSFTRFVRFRFKREKI